MKKLFLVVAFMFIGSAMFAASTENANILQTNCDQLKNDVVAAWYNAGYSFERAAAEGNRAYYDCKGMSEPPEGQE